MKKATFLISFVISLTAINAQTILEPINSYQNTSLGTGIIPGNYSSTQKAQLYHISHSSQEDITINILNPKFECIKSITQSIEAVTGHNSVYDKQQVLAAICTKTDSIQCTFTSYKDSYNQTRNVLTGYEIDTDHVSSSEARYTPELASKYLRELTGEQISVENENGIYTFLPSSSSKYYLYNQFDNAYPLWFATLDLTGGQTESILQQHYVTYKESSKPHYRLVDAVYFISQSTESVVFKQIGSKKKVYRRFTNDTNSSSYYFMQGTFGDKYLYSYLMLLRDGSLYNITKNYKTMYEESKDWNLISQTSVSEYYYPVTIQQSLIQPGIKSADTFTISQTLFNNDELFEYILPIPEKYDDEVLSEKNIGDITIPVKQTFAKWRINGYKIVNELGHEICRLTLPTGYDGATSMQLFDYGDEQYMTVNASIDTDSGKQTDTFVYKITREEHNAAIEQVGAPMRVDISPRLVSQSMPIDIKFSDESTQQRQIIVTSTNGVTQMVLTLSPQTLSATVDTSHLPAGMYVISVKDGESVTENCKVIIR